MIRTTEELVDRISEELVWRRKELTDMRALVQESRGLVRCNVAIRAAVALLYAHWEGFVKKTASYYLEYVASHRIPYKQLAPNFVALALKGKFIEMRASEKVSSANGLADFFCSALDSPSNVPYKKVVDTKSNLSSKVMIDILTALGLEKGWFETKVHYVDANLVNARNHIAHGESLNVSLDDYLVLHEEVIGLIEGFRTEVENSSVLRRFERVPA